MASEHSPLLPNSHSNNYTPSEREIERPQQHAPGATDLTNEYTSLYPHCPQGTLTNSVNSSDDDVKLSTDSSSFRPHTTNNTESMMNFMKGMLGTGILAVPAALKYSGLWVGFVSLGFLGIVNGYCMTMLVRCSASLCARTGKETMSYSDVAEEAFKMGPRPLRKFASLSRIIINVFLCITQFGFCIVYILFVAKTIKQMVDDLTSVHLSLTLYMFFMVLLLLPFMFVRNLKHLAPFSLVANLLVLTGLIVIVQHCVRGLPTDHYPPAFAGWKTLPLYFGIALYAFEGIGVVLPIENKMRWRQDFGGWTGVLTTGMVLVVVMYMTLGFYGYIMYQDKIEGTITLNLPTSSLLFLLVKVAFAIAIFISYGLQFYVPIQILWPLAQRRLPVNSWSSRNGELVLRFVFVLATFAIAATVPQLELMISLVGAFSSCALALIFPPVLNIITFWPLEGACGTLKLVKDIVICLFGLCGFTAGTVVTLIKLINTFEYGGTNT